MLDTHSLEKRRTRPPVKRFRAYQFIATGVVLLLVVVTAIGALVRLRNQAELRAISNAQNLARSMDQTMAGLIGQIDIALQASADDIQHEKTLSRDPGRTISLRMEKQHLRLDLVRTYRATDAAGNAIYGADIKAPSLDLSDRDFFRKLRADPASGLVISGPVKGRLSNDWVWVLARPVTLPDGHFDGVVFAAISVNSLSEMFGKVKLGESDAITLRGPDLGLITRFPMPADEEPGFNDTRVSQPMREAFEANLMAGTYVSGASAVDGISRRQAFVRNPRYGYIVNVGLGQDEVLAEWRRQFWLISGLALVLILGTLTFGWIIYRASLREERDIAELHASRLALMERERMLARSQAAAHLGSWTWKAYNGDTVWSEEQYRIFGVTRDSFVPSLDSFAKTVLAADLPVVQDAFQGILSGEYDFANLEFAIVRPTGEIRHVRADAVAQRNDENWLVEMYGTIADITEQKTAQLALAQSESELRDAQRVAGVGNWVWILATGEHRWSEEVFRFFGRDPAAGPVPYPEVRSYFLEESWEQLAAAMESCRREGGRFGMDVDVIREDGVKVCGYVRCEATLDEAGAVINLHGTIMDITRRKHLEEELKFHRDHLEATVAARTAALVEARDAAEAASRAKSSFLANMSHELRTPMNAILGFTELVRRDATDAKMADYLNKVSTSAYHLLSVINDILDISKIEAEQMAIESVPLQVPAIIENVRTMVAEKAAGKGLALHVEVDPALTRWGLCGDPLRLSQVLLNLAGNAVKFTRAGRIDIRARCIRESQSDMLVGFEVSDTGIGIRNEQIGKLFAAFEQADNSTTRLFGGTGLGLYICKTLVERMGGDIGVNSVPGQGSTFWVSLLLHKETGDELPVASNEAREVRIATLSDLQHCRVLLVEDEPINQEVTSLLLENVGVQVDIAADGIIAIEKALQTDYALILMDVSMPRMDGLEATHRIRQLPDRAHTPIIAMTANAFVEDKARCLAAGMNDFLTKPAKPEDLVAMLLRWVKPKVVVEA